MQVVLLVGETQLGKNLQDSIGKRPFTGRYLCYLIPWYVCMCMYILLYIHNGYLDC